jgi:hypothetical protein
MKVWGGVIVVLLLILAAFFYHHSGASNVTPTLQGNAETASHPAGG